MENNIRTFKDFLQFYNLMSQTCFSHCIDSFKTRDLEPHEIACVEKCAHKLIRYNNRAISVYADVQTKLMTKRQQEMEALNESNRKTDEIQETTTSNVAELQNTSSEIAKETDETSSQAE